MFDPKVELAAFLDDHGVAGWVTGEMGQQLRLEDWVDWFVDRCHQALDTDGADAVERLTEVQSMLDAPPGRKTISVSQLREVLDQ